ncbi:hypothetical protein [Streptomyces sp. WMMC1477]|uniref:hypothetical protein n=1 Tax=Streptomyces sp. WMMC1477 TaxID=3015155 RepID=UPI0022B744AE|nr:hypothetical protein [Streptomyces sp. WMMC1477]MCZ7430589.1 hypothetical protein [Streptomyces sp. WMMC1477]
MRTVHALTGPALSAAIPVALGLAAEPAAAAGGQGSRGTGGFLITAAVLAVGALCGSLLHRRRGRDRF